MRKIYFVLLSSLLSFAAKAQFPAPYCAEAFSNGIEPITNVVFNTINQTSATPSSAAHEDYTAVATTAVLGETYTLSVKGNTDGNYSDGVVAYFDFNNNGVFTDAGEVFIVGVLRNSTGLDAVVASTSITIPTTVAPGNKRMRIIKLYADFADPCNTDGFGQAEDYTVTVVAPPCTPPGNVRFTSVSGTNASISWTAASGVSSYQYAITTSATAPTSGTVTNGTTATLGSLPANTPLFAYVRSVCGANSFTPWVAALSNDSCGAAITLAPNAAVSGTNTNATQSSVPVACAGATSATPINDVWYRISARQNGTASVTVSTTTLSFDAVLVAYSGACSGLTNIGCADANGPGTGETLNLSGLVAGESYLIRVYGYSNVISAQGTFTITATGPALPVTGVMLSALRQGKTVQLGWKTETEINSTGFELQRSADGSSFTSLQKIASKASGGNSTSAITYTAEDAKPLTGAAYYRLKQTDKDGKVNYSNTAFIKSLPVSGLTVSSIYPNPVRSVLKAAVQSPATDQITFLISDMTGKTISRQMSSVTAGDNTISLNVTSLPAGNYLLKAICSNGCETAIQKFTKQ